MITDPGFAGSREGKLKQLDQQLSSALDLSDAVDEFLLSAQIALALDTLRAALIGPGDGALGAREVGVSAG